MNIATPHRYRKTAGFTLLEVMIVAFILAMIASTVVVNMTSAQRESDVRTASVVFKEKVNHARQIALIRNWVMGVHVEAHSYAFYRWYEGQWQRLQDGALAGVELRELEFELLMGDFAILDNIVDGDRQAAFRPVQEERNDDDEEAVQPSLMIFESSDFVPFSLGVHDHFSGESYWIDGRDGLHLSLTDEAP